MGQLVELMEVARPTIDDQDWLDNFGGTFRFDSNEVHVDTLDLGGELWEAVQEVDLLFPVIVVSPMLYDFLKIISIEAVLETVNIQQWYDELGFVQPGMQILDDGFIVDHLEWLNCGIVFRNRFTSY